MLRAHRVAWELYYGTVPDGLNVLHNCDTPCCVNPRHLFIGTQADNIADMRIKCRNRDAHGTQRRNAKITEDDVLEIRKRRNNGESPTVLAHEYGMDVSNMVKICKGKAWAHVHE